LVYVISYDLLLSGQTDDSLVVRTVHISSASV